jgi:predicted DNA-binding protein (UPF0251 family)
VRVALEVLRIFSSFAVPGSNRQAVSVNFINMKAVIRRECEPSESFLRGCKGKSFTLAAKQMNVSQPTLSMQVKSLRERFCRSAYQTNKKAFEVTKREHRLQACREDLFSYP